MPYFPCEKRLEINGSYVNAIQQTITEEECPYLWNMAKAGRLFLVLLSNRDLPTTVLGRYLCGEKKTRKLTNARKGLSTV